MRLDSIDAQGRDFGHFYLKNGVLEAYLVEVNGEMCITADLRFQEGSDHITAVFGNGSRLINKMARLMKESLDRRCEKLPDVYSKVEARCVVTELVHEEEDIYTYMLFRF